MGAERPRTTVRLARLMLATALAAGLTGAAAVGPASARLETKTLVPSARTEAYIDPQLLTQLGGPSVPAIFAWDEREATHAQIDAYLRGQGIDAHLFSSSTGYACAGSLDVVQAMAGAPGMLSIYSDRPLTPALKKSVATAFNGNPNDVWQGLGLQGEGIGIAVVDTGVDGGHPDLDYATRMKFNIRVLYAQRDVENKFDPCPNIDVYQPESTENTEITSGHGTHLASVAAGDGTASGGKFKGVAPKAHLVGVGVSDTVSPRVRPMGDQAISMMGAMAGMDWVQVNYTEGPNKVKVLLAGWTMRGVFDEVLNPVTKTIQGLTDNGITVVVPAGNEGPAQSDCSREETCYFNLAGVRSAIAVGAGPRDIRGVLEDYSSRGDPVEYISRDEPARFEPTIIAPGTDVTAARHIGLAPFVETEYSPSAANRSGRITTDPNYVPLTGTSVAAAHVAGAVALMQEAAVEAKGCYLNPSQVKEVLQATATPMAGQRWEVGAGMIDITAAVSYARFIPADQSPDGWRCPGLGNK